MFISRVTAIRIRAEMSTNHIHFWCFSQARISSTGSWPRAEVPASGCTIEILAPDLLHETLLTLHRYPSPGYLD